MKFFFFFFNVPENFITLNKIKKVLKFFRKNLRPDVAKRERNSPLK